MAWGTNAGYAINPARDFGPRLAVFITGYGGALQDQYGDLYFWVPIVGPIIGGLIGGALYKVLIGPVPARGRARRAGQRARRRRPPSTTAPTPQTT